ncbi:unnamed protein product (macronuclear) [Paramecium tetraurelia]|uniref:Transmembrane protein n=1 Tax=Paramecium tetraurelia TaxID=5888 RepID=A0CGD5_PARTE|nr:uncharacterized protein GSPATT00007292001 [Paramecium tetraurelia]CAK69852.1 unnamed protein product [Paramecium tetraurelia]|eukprot:XP_001437249.1 hypothetical protein (macronuclear) [Paramecium tetraurelia strain d4-2]
MQSPNPIQQNEDQNLRDDISSKPSLARSNTFQPIPKITKKFTIGGKEYSYVGPDHPYIQDLFQLVEERESNPKFIWINKIITINNQLEQWFSAKCRFFDGGFEITHYHVLIWFFYLIIYVVYIIQTLDLQNSSEVQANANKQSIVYNLAGLGALFTIYTLVIIMIKQTWIVFIITFLGVLLPIWFLSNNYLNLLNLNSSANYDFSMIFILAFIVLIVLNGLIVSQLYIWLKSFMKEFFAAMVVNFWCLFCVFLVGYYVLEYVIVTSQLVFSDLITYVLSTLYIPLLLILVFSWFIIKARLFDWPEDVIQTAIDRLKNMLEKQYIRSQTTQQQTLSWIQRNKVRIISYMIGIFYFIVEIWLFLKLSSILQNQYSNYSEIMTLAFEVTIVPIYLFLGVFISITNRDLSKTLLYIPLFLGAPIIFSFLKLYFYLDSQSTTQDMVLSIGDAIYYGPLFLFTIWLTISMIGIEKRKLQMYSLGFLCFFLAFPLGVLIPLYYESDDGSLLYTSYVLVGIGAIILIVIFAYFIKLSISAVWRVKQISEDDFPNFGEYAYYNLTPYGLWINAAFFLLSIFFLGEFFWFSQEFDKEYQPTDVEIGTIFSLLVMHPILFFLTNLALSGRSLQIKNDFEITNLDMEKIEQIENEKKMKALKIQNYTVLTGLICPIVVFIPFGAIISNEIFSTFFMALAFGLPLIFLLYKVLTYIKNQSEAYENFFSSFVSSLLWCCVIFPFGVIVPMLSIEFVNTSENFQTFAQIAVASGLFICIFGVTGTSLFFSILLNKEEFERKKRFVVEGLIAYFYKEHVYSDMAVCSLIYMRYLIIGNVVERRVKKQQKPGLQDKNNKEINQKQEIKQILVKDLIEEFKPVGPIEYLGEDLECNKQLVSKLNYDKFTKAIEQKKIEEKEKKQNQCLMMFWECIQCKCGLEEIEQLEKDKENEIILLRDIYKMDEEQGQMMEQLIPEFSSVYKLMDDNEKTGLLLNFELEPTAQILAQKKQHIDVEQLVSSKTEKFRNLERKDISNKAISKITSTDYYQSLQQDNNLFPQFMHEVFMEFSNQEEGLPPSICYNDFKEFCRLTDLNFGIIEYTTHAKQIWLNQTYSLSELDFANLLKSALPNNSVDKYQQLKQLTLSNIYPGLIKSIKSLYSNLKETNRLLLNNVLDPKLYPFCQENFDGRKQTKQEMQDEQSMLLLQINDGQNSQNNQIKRANSIKFPKKSRKQLNFEYAEKVQEVEHKYDNKLSCCKKCCYSFLRCLNLVFCQILGACWKTILGGFEDQKKKPVRKGWAQRVNEARLEMRDWKQVAKGGIEELFRQINIYEEQQKKKLVVKQFRPTLSNIIAISTRFYDVYGLAALTFNSNVSWFGNDSASSVQGQDVVDGAAFYDSYAFYFYASLFASVLYGILGRIAVHHVKQNTFGQNTLNGLPASYTHPQWYLTKAIQILNGLFLRIMKSFIDAFVCDYDIVGSVSYVLVRDHSVECLSEQHYIYMGLAFLGVSIYYPLTTYMQPIFQFNDHSLDLKYRSTYLVVYVQCKLLILGLSSLFANFDSNSFIFQLIFASCIMLFIIIFYLRMKPCLIDWFNIIELFLFIIVFSVYIGAILILFTSNYIYGLLFTGSTTALLLIILAIYFIRQFLDQRRREKIGIESDQQQLQIKQKKGITKFVETKTEERMRIANFKGKDKVREEKQLKMNFETLEEQEKEQKQMKKIQVAQKQKSQSDLNLDSEYMPIKQIEGNINEDPIEHKNIKLFQQRKT